MLQPGQSVPHPGGNTSVDDIVRMLATLSEVGDLREQLTNQVSSNLRTSTSLIGTTRTDLQRPITETADAVSAAGAQAIGTLAHPIESAIIGTLGGIQEVINSLPRPEPIAPVYRRDPVLDYVPPVDLDPSNGNDGEMPGVPDFDDTDAAEDVTPPQVNGDNGGQVQVNCQPGCPPQNLQVNVTCRLDASPPGDDGEVGLVNVEDPQPCRPTPPTIASDLMNDTVGRVPIINFASASVCQQLLEYRHQQAPTNCSLSYYLGMVDERCQDRMSSFFDQFDINIPETRFTPAFCFMLGTMLDGALHGLMIIPNAYIRLAGQGQCEQALSVFATVVSAVTGAIENWLTGPLPQVSTPIRQLANWACPREIPSVADVLNLYLADTIDLDYSHCLSRANGLPTPFFDHLKTAQQNWFTMSDLISLRWRNQINDNGFRSMTRRLGYLDPQIPFTQLELARYIPSISDLITMMVRDVADPDIVTRFGLDSEFTDKWQGDLKRLGEWQGVSDDMARLHWRAHWTIPSPTQLFEFWRRLRHVPAGQSTSVSYDDIRKALIQQDILPFWIDKYLAVSYNPLTRTDSRRAFEIGAINRDQLRSSFIDAGYSDDNADILVEFSEKQLSLKMINHRSVKQYIAGAINLHDLRQALVALGIGQSLITEIITHAQNERNIRVRKTCVTALRKRFLSGEFNDDSAIAMLADQGFAPGDSADIVREWRCEYHSQDKSVAVNQLCKWLDRGLIDEQDYYFRVRRLGYSETDATRIINHCRLELTDKQKKAFERAAQEQLRRAEQQERKEERLKAARDRKEAKKDSMRERSLKNRRANENILIRAALKIAKDTEMDVPTVVTRLREAFRNIRRDLELSPSEILDVFKKVAERTKDKSLTEALQMIMDAARLLRYEPAYEETTPVD